MEGWKNYATWLTEKWLYEEPKLRKKVIALVDGASDSDDLAGQIEELVMSEMAEVAWDQIAALHWYEKYPPIW